MPEKDKHTNETRSPDLIFSGINYAAGLLALAALHEGVRVGFIIKDPPETTFDPELTSFYPSTYRQLPRTVNEVRFLEACSTLFPHLFFPQRCLFFTPQNSIDTRLNTFFDTLTGRDRDQAALVVNKADVPGPAFPENFPDKVALVGEYRFDRNMAILELLHLCLAKGAVLLDRFSHESRALLIECEAPSQLESGTTCAGFPYPWQNPVRISRKDYSLLLHKSGSDLKFKLVTGSKHPNSGMIADARMLLHQIFPDVLEDSLEQLQKNEVQVEQTDPLVLSDPPLSEIRRHLLHWQARLGREIKRTIDVEKTLKAMGGSAISGEQFRMLQNECDAQFGLARQSGITFEQFSTLFYRYRPYISDMIEEAYELMAEIRDPAVLWKNIEHNRLKNILDGLNFNRL